VQGHFVDTPKAQPEGAGGLHKDVFLDSDYTDVMVLSCASHRAGGAGRSRPPDAVRRIVERPAGDHRSAPRPRAPNRRANLSLWTSQEKWRVSA